MQNRWTPLAIFPETLDPPAPAPAPPRDFGKNFKYPPWIFNPCASMLLWHKISNYLMAETTFDQFSSLQVIYQQKLLNTIFLTIMPLEINGQRSENL